MTDYLVAISIGPVQSLIEAGRRAQDLWCGSWILSEVARAVALRLHDAQHDCLIFPNPANPSQALQPQTRNSLPAANIANVVRASVKVNDATQLATLIAEAKQAAYNRLESVFSEVVNNVQLQDTGIDKERWQQQQQDVLEVFAAWVTWSPADEQSYSNAAKRLSQLLQARKLTRNFAPMGDNKSGLHKSSLDGANNTVTNLLTAPEAAVNLAISAQMVNEKKRLLGLTNEEELDALGVVKRRAGQLEQFTPFSRIVAHDWLNSLDDAVRQTLNTLYEPLFKAGHVSKVAGNDGTYENFPFDGEYLFSSRLTQADIAQNDKTSLLDFVEAQHKQYGTPLSYGVLLKADGDRMGELLAKAKGPIQSKAISIALHEFASNVRTILKSHGGHAIYAGGDDVLAFVPLAGAFACAKELAHDFKNKMEKVTQTEKIEIVHTPTLSVGLAIGHFVQPMRQLRQRAIAAEKYAKGNHTSTPRNALAVHLGIRSGHEITWRCRWDDEQTLKNFEYVTAAFTKGWLLTRIMHDVREMAQRLKWAEAQQLNGICESEFERMLLRSEFKVVINDSDKSADEKAEVKKKSLNTLKATLRQQAAACSLNELANLLELARWLSAKTAADIEGAE